MKSSILALMISGPAFVLAGCVAPAAYEPIHTNEYGYGVGFMSRQIDAADFHVGFVGNTQTDPQRVADFVLLRAAEITLENHFSSFVVVHERRSTEAIGLPWDLDEEYPDDPYQRPVNAAAANVGYFDDAASKTIVNKMILRIHCDTNAPPPGPQNKVYDARQISTELRGKYGLSGS